MDKKNLLLFLLLSFSIKYISAQDKPDIKFGKISPSDFIISSSVVDSNSNAVVLADIGNSEFEGNNNGWFTLVFKRQERVKILNKNGFNAANIVIPLYTDGDKTQKLNDLQGSVYNIDNGVITESKFDTKNVFQEKLTKNWILKKFTFPGVKEGSIIEYSYTIKSDFYFNLPSWLFQGKFPCLWSEYDISVPQFFEFVYLSTGSAIFYKNEKMYKDQTFRVEDPTPSSDSYASQKKEYLITGSVLKQRWVMKEVPALKEESFSSTNKNFQSGIEFQLSDIRFSDDVPEDKLGNWTLVTNILLDEDDFGGAINKDNYWSTNEINNAAQKAPGDLDKTRNTFGYVRDNFTCTGNSGIYLSVNSTLRDVYKKKAGNVADINLLLISLLRQQGINADPVILSTRDYGLVHPVYPLLHKFNYVLCRVKIDGAIFYLDATNRHLGFNKIPLECYNGLAKVINKDTLSVYFRTDSIKESNVTTISLTNNEKEGMTGNFSTELGYYESLALRDQLAITKEDDYFKEKAKGYPENMQILNPEINSLNQYDAPLKIKCDIKLIWGNEDMQYVNPMFSEAIKENPFKSEDHRLYPVELPYSSNKTYNLSLDIPKGYKVDELPKPQTFLLTNNGAKFDYQILQFPDHIQLRCLLQVSQTFFNAGDYDNLREFFAQVIKKENENIVFKKIQ